MSSLWPLSMTNSYLEPILPLQSLIKTFQINKTFPLEILLLKQENTIPSLSLMQHPPNALEKLELSQKFSNSKALKPR